MKIQLLCCLLAGTAIADVRARSERIPGGEMIGTGIGISIRTTEMVVNVKATSIKKVARAALRSDDAHDEAGKALTLAIMLARALERRKTKRPRLRRVLK